MPHSMVAVYELNAEGKITAWREYLDTADLAKKKGYPWIRLADRNWPNPKDLNTLYLHGLALSGPKEAYSWSNNEHGL